MKLLKRKCKGCGVDISKKHINAKFHSQNCKDKFWNKKNPRGYGLKSSQPDFSECGWDSHKESF